MARFLDKMQNSLQRQVIIEAKILEVELNDGFQSGIDWSLLGLQQQGSLINDNFMGMLQVKVSAFEGGFTTVMQLFKPTRQSPSVIEPTNIHSE